MLADACAQDAARAPPGGMGGQGGTRTPSSAPSAGTGLCTPDPQYHLKGNNAFNFDVPQVCSLLLTKPFPSAECGGQPITAAALAGTDWPGHPGRHQGGAAAARAGAAAGRAPGGAALDRLQVSRDGLEATASAMPQRTGC